VLRDCCVLRECYTLRDALRDVLRDALRDTLNECCTLSEGYALREYYTLRVSAACYVLYSIRLESAMHLVIISLKGLRLIYRGVLSTI
jgi:hypothetical protein